MEYVILSFDDNLRAYYKDDTILCMSEDGATPADMALVPQAKKCAVCTQNQWGSLITPNGKRAKACSEFAWLSLLAPDDTSKYQMRVSSTSLRALRDYEKSLKDRGCNVKDVVTKVITETTNTHDLLSFRVVRFLDDGELENLIQLSNVRAPMFEPVDGYTH